MFLPVLHGCGAHTYGLPPRIPCGPSSTKSTSRCFVLPPKPPATGGCTPRLEPKKKLFIQLHSSTRPLPAVRYRSTLSVPGLLIQPPSQILLCQARYGWRLLPPRRASAAFALRSPASLGRGADVSVALLWKQHRLILPACPAKPYGELHANPAQALQERSGSPADPNGSRRSGRRLPSRLQPPGPVFLRGPTAYPAGLWSLRPKVPCSFAAYA